MNHFSHRDQVAHLSVRSVSTRTGRLRAAVRSVAFEILESRRLFAALTVNTTADTNSPDGVLSLREAISVVNGSLSLSSLDAGEFAQVDITQPLGSMDTIKFNIPGTGVQTIFYKSSLPTLVNAVKIDGYSQPGATANTLAVGDNANILIKIDGSQSNSTGDALILGSASSGSVIRGLAIDSVVGTAIFIADGTGSTIAGNFIGVDTDGTTAAGNGSDAVSGDAAGNTIGGTAAADRNIISGNSVSGIHLFSGASNTVIENNYIGVDATGTTALSNGFYGVRIESTGNKIGQAGAGNVISGNKDDGIHLEGSDGVSSNTIVGNYIGTNATGTAAIGNGDDGVEIDGENGSPDDATMITIGGIAAGTGNLISGNTNNGISLSGNGAGGITIQGNVIGLNLAGTAALGNGNSGISTEFTTSLIIGGTTAAARNVISGNNLDGINLLGADGSLIQGNYIGLSSDGTAAIGNAFFGLTAGKSSVTIGGSTAGAGNVISGNVLGGVGLGVASGSVIQGNRIGLYATGSTGPGNGGDGLRVGDSSVIIGGPIASDGNTIAFNQGAGIIAVYDSRAVIRLNSIYSNLGLGIDLSSLNSGLADGVTANDPGDDDTGPNNLQNYPVVVSATATATMLSVAGTFNSTANTTFTLDFYATDEVDPSGSGEGKQYVGSIGVITDAFGNASFSGTFNTAIGLNTYISATATDTPNAPHGNTSEFSQSVQASVVIPPAPPRVAINDLAQTEGNAGTTTFTFTLTRSGDLSNPSVVSVSTADGAAPTGATAGSDYAVLSGVMVAFAANQSSAMVTVNVNGDTTVEANETFNVNVTSISNATIGDGQGVGTIINDDVAPPPPAMTGTLSGYTFNDGNANGQLDGGDVKTSGKTVFLDTNNNGVLDAGEKSVVTDSSGNFSFGNLAAGTYHVRRVFPSGYTYSNAPIDVTLSGGQTISGLAIGSKPTTTPPPPPSATGSLSGFSFDDANKDGQFEVGETKTSGKTVFLDTNNNGVLDAGEKSFVSDSSGNFTFSGLSAGTYHVRRVFPSGYTYSTTLIDVTLSAGQTIGGLQIGSKPTGGTPPPPTTYNTASLGGFTFDDANKDGHYETGETKTSGKLVFLDSNNNGKLDAGEKSMVTGANGAFNFGGLAAGMYHVRRVFPNGFSYSTKLIDLMLVDGQTAPGLQIGSKPN